VRGWDEGRGRVGELEAGAWGAEYCDGDVAGVGAGSARGRAELGDRTSAPQDRHVDVDWTGHHLGGEHGRDAPQRLVRFGEFGDHGPHDGRGDEPAVRDDRTVPLLADLGAERAVGVARGDTAVASSNFVGGILT
jgi:hypothetical protein